MEFYVSFRGAALWSVSERRVQMICDSKRVE